MGRLSNRDVDDLTQMTYEDALADGEPWADEALRVREWAALDGKRVMVEFDDGCKARGRWQWRGQTAEDFYCVFVEIGESAMDERAEEIACVCDVTNVACGSRRDHQRQEDAAMSSWFFRHGWPRPLWPLGRFVNRHRDPFSGRWHWRSFGG